MDSNQIQDQPLLDAIVSLLANPWRPGQLLLDLQTLGLRIDRADWPRVIVTAASAAVRVCILSNYCFIHLLMFHKPSYGANHGQDVLYCDDVFSELYRYHLRVTLRMVSGRITGPTP